MLYPDSIEVQESNLTFRLRSIPQRPDVFDRKVAHNTLKEVSGLSVQPMSPTLIGSDLKTPNPNDFPASRVNSVPFLGQLEPGRIAEAEALAIWNHRRSLVDIRFA
jgi:hypothetical protein